MLSLTDPATLPSVDSTGGVTPTALQPLLAWFNRTFQQLPGPSQTSPADDDDLTGAASGVEIVVKQLQGAAAARAGTAEELQALFVALCRAQSLLVRSVRCATALKGCIPVQRASKYSSAELMKGPGVMSSRVVHCGTGGHPSYVSVGSLAHWWEGYSLHAVTILVTVLRAKHCCL